MMILVKQTQLPMPYSAIIIATYGDAMK